MKKLFTGMIASLLVLGLVGSAFAAGAITTNSSLTTDGQIFAAGSNTTTYTFSANGTTLTGPLFRPLTGTAVANFNPSTLAVLGTKGTNLVYVDQNNASFNWTNPTAWGSQMNETQLVGIANALQNIIGYTGVNTSKSAAMTTTISGDTTYAAKVNTALFDNLYTPPLMAARVPAGGMVLTQYPVPASTMQSYQVGQLEVWKFIPTIAGVKTKDAVKYSLATASTDITGTTDGQIWFTTDQAGNSIMSSSSTFPAAGAFMWMTIRDGGSFDLDGSAGAVVDPPTVTPATTTSSSTSGCVYNPAAGLSLDLLFLAVPALGVLASRIRRK